MAIIADLSQGTVRISISRGLTYFGIYVDEFFYSFFFSLFRYVSNKIDVTAAKGQALLFLRQWISHYEVDEKLESKTKKAFKGNQVRKGRNIAYEFSVAFDTTKPA